MSIFSFVTANRDQILRGWDLVRKCIPNYVHSGITNIGRIFDTPGIEEELKGGAYAPDLNSILESPHGLYFGVIAGSPFRDDIVTEFANMARLGHSFEK